MTQPIVRTYKNAEEALEAANREVARLQYEWDMQRYSAFGEPIDPKRLNAPKQFEYEKPEPTTQASIDLSQLVAGDKVRLRCGEICIVSQFNKHELEYPLLCDFRGYALRFDRSGKPRPAGVLAIRLSVRSLEQMTESDFQIISIQKSGQEPQPEPSGFLRGLGIRVGDTVKLKNGDTGMVMATDAVDASGNSKLISVELKGRLIAYDFDGWPNNDSLCRFCEDTGLPRGSSVSDFKIVSITRDKGRLSQITITNNPEPAHAPFDFPPIVAGMEFE